LRPPEKGKNLGGDHKKKKRGGWAKRISLKQERKRTGEEAAHMTNTEG